MEKSSVFINSRSIIRHIDESQLNLTGLPSFPTSVNLGAHAPKYAGYVSYYESARDFAFLLTNGCRIDKGNAHTNLKEIDILFKKKKKKKTEQYPCPVKYYKWLYFGVYSKLDTI